MSLEEYEKKRNFSKTPEPVGKTGNSENIFVVQEHNSSHLHWDFRLSIGGVLKSWAIPKEPPRKNGIKRLAVQTEDHPLDYADFEGEIPEGEYGAGTVKIWDKGKYEKESFRKDKLVFFLKGKKLKGGYVLLKFKGSGNEKNWIFFRKKND